MEPFPPVSPAGHHEGLAVPAQDGARSRSSSASKVLQHKASLSHRRSRSGSLIAKFPFLRGTAGAEAASDDDAGDSLDGDQAAGLGLDGAGAVHSTSQAASRRRKGSLRKMALLGTGKLRSGVDRKSPLADATSPKRYPILRAESISPPDDPEPKSSSEYETSNRPGPNTVKTMPTVYGQLSAGPMSLTLDTSDERINVMKNAPFTGPANLYTSTTDDDEALTMPPGLAIPAAKAHAHSPSSSESSALAPPVMPLPIQRRRSTKTHAPPPASVPLQDYKSMHDMSTMMEDEWDYSVTEWWGWSILVVTWIVFIVGMGSCFEVWSWAWDVGETPYAPPELEDDPTLPIVGYYPALMVLTAVMSWIWVAVAWVGMKYFKHAKINPG